MRARSAGSSVLSTVPTAVSTAAWAETDTAAKAMTFCPWDESRSPLLCSVDSIASQAADTAGMSTCAAVLMRSLSVQSTSEVSVPPPCCCSSATALVTPRTLCIKMPSSFRACRCLISTTSSTCAAILACSAPFDWTTSIPGSVRKCAIPSRASEVRMHTVPR